jgi:multicomponent Na+:H+ antiporter subunit F
MLSAAAAALLVTLALALARGLAGPTVFDRLQAGNTIGTAALLLLTLMGFLNGRPDFIDLAIVYAFLNIVGTIAVLRFFRYGGVSDPGRAEGPP